MNAKAPGRFKFTLKDDMDFNYEVVIDIMYIGSKPVLHVVDTATAFQAARFLKDISTKTVWDALRLCWIDVYLGPPDVIAHDAGKQLASTEFRQNARAMAIEVKEVPVEAHNSIGKVERYHAPLRTKSVVKRLMPLPKRSYKWLSKRSMIQQDLMALCLRSWSSERTPA
jgi:hypothetical protein